MYRKSRGLWRVENLYEAASLSSPPGADFPRGPLLTRLFKKWSRDSLYLSRLSLTCGFFSDEAHS